LITRIAKGRKFKVTVRNFVFETIHNSYGEFINYDTPKDKRINDGKRIALYNSNNHLEIALYKSSLETAGGASTLLGISYRDSISVTFSEKE